MNDHDPRPLVEGSDASEALREALAAARADMPRADRLAALAARLPLGAPPPAAPGKVAPGNAAPAAPSVLSGALLGAALGVVVSGVGLFWDSQRTAPASPPSVAASPASLPRPALPQAAADPPHAPAPRAAVLESKPSAAVPPRGALTPAVSPGEAPPSASAPAEAPPSVAVPDVAGGPKDDRSETDLLESARNRLSANPGEALSLTQEHAVRFPRGALSQERELLAIQALLALGRGDEARARRDRFVSTYPGSAHKRRLDALFAPSP
jgi:hypothetical protein